MVVLPTAVKHERHLELVPLVQDFGSSQASDREGPVEAIVLQAKGLRLWLVIRGQNQESPVESSRGCFLAPEGAMVIVELVVWFVLSVRREGPEQDLDAWPVSKLG